MLLAEDMNIWHQKSSINVLLAHIDSSYLAQPEVMLVSLFDACVDDDTAI